MDYEEIFAARGNSYDQAMRAVPNARDEEFELIVNALNLETIQTLADIPAGGGYFERYLPESIKWLNFEPCAEFTGHQILSENEFSMSNLPWEHSSIDAAVSIAGVHHLADKSNLWQEIQRILSPEGQFVIADVKEGSQVSLFLDDFVGQYNVTGHEGIYLTDTTSNSLVEAGLNINYTKEHEFKWHFASVSQMAGFCTRLFGLQNVSQNTVLENIERYLGINHEVSGAVSLNWSLMLIVGTK